MRQQATKTLLTLLLMLPLTVFQGAPSAAQTPQQRSGAGASGIALTPSVQTKTLSPEDASASFTIRLSNFTSAPLDMSLRTTDFTALNQTGGLAFTGTDARAVTEGNGLSSILKLEAPLVRLAANSTRTVTVSVDDVSTLAPGGHYAAVIAQAIPGETADNQNNVSIYQAVSSLIFLETAGQGTKKLELVPPSLDRISFSLPQSLNVTLKSTGNTQVIPRGVVTVSRGDKELQRGIINPDSSLVLPGSTRLLQTPLKGDTNPWLPGVYTLTIQYRYDGTQEVLTYTKQFLYLNVLALASVIGVLIAGVLVFLQLFRRRSALYRMVRPRKKAASTQTAVDNKVIRRIEVK